MARQKGTKKKKEKMILMTVTISKKLHLKLKAMAKEQKKSFSRLCREIIKDMLDTLDAEKAF